MKNAESKNNNEKGDWTKAVRTGTRGIGVVGYLSIILLAGAFGVWAATAPISGAAIVQGFVAASGQNQVVQHLEGGIVSKILVREGERVSAGTPMFEMDSTRARATLNTLKKQWISLKARHARLAARRDGKQDIDFDPQLTETAKDSGLSDILDEQRNEFLARLSRHKSERIILRQRVDAAEDAIKGLESQKKALDEQLAVVSEEAGRKKELLDKGLTNRSEYTLLLRSQADLVGQLGSISAQMAQTNSRIIEAREELIRQDTSRIEDAMRELNDVAVNLGEVDENLNAAQDVLDRAIVRAPTDGLIIRVTKTTPGSVVQPGEDLSYILPTSSELIIEARLNPTDIDLVRPGQPARLRFIALNARKTPEVAGTVTYISPDRLVDQDKKPFYAARIQITGDLPAEVERYQIYPGMPVEAMISTTERTFFEYLIQPLSDSLAHAFREQ